jgi:hypothetical protein
MNCLAPFFTSFVAADSCGRIWPNLLWLKTGVVDLEQDGQARGGSNMQTGGVSSRVDRRCFQRGRPAPAHAAVLGLRLPLAVAATTNCGGGRRRCRALAPTPLPRPWAPTLHDLAAAMPLGFLHHREKYMAPTRGKSARKKLNLSRRIRIPRARLRDDRSLQRYA